MIAPLMAMQARAISNINMGQASMMRNCSAMSFGASQPLRPSSFAYENALDLQNAANETRVSVAQHLYEAIQKALSANIKRSVPNFGGLDYKA